jgi:two-component system copper resistance phosphate regulon response regulator CusR
MRILVIEDSETLRESLTFGLRKSGFQVDAVGDGPEGLAYAEIGPYDVVILDLMLPKRDGLSVLRALRTSGSTVPILILSAKDKVEDRVHGLALGADDYLVKPFAFDELVARIRALQRRLHEVREPVVRYGKLEIDLSFRRVSLDGAEIRPTPLEYALLEMLALRKGRVASREEILRHLYDSSSDVESNVIEVLVRSLRRKIQPAGSPEILFNRRGFGYWLEEPRS